MDWHKTTLHIATRGKGMYDFTSQVASQVEEWGIGEGMCYLFLQHTSASLVIQESYDPSAKAVAYGAVSKHGRGLMSSSPKFLAV